MSRNWIVQGDKTTSGGSLVTWSPFTDVNGKGVVRFNDKASCPLHKGMFPIVAGCDTTTIIDGQPVALHGATLSCGCKVLAGQQMQVFLDAGGPTAMASSFTPTGKSAAASSSPVSFKTEFDAAMGSPASLDSAAETDEADDCEAKFKKVSKIVLANEGGFVDDPDDAGGATNMGIAWRTWQSYASADLGVEPTILNLQALTEEQAEIIYRKRYWEPRGFCKIDNPRTALMIYDWTITSGKAVREVQEVLISSFGKELAADNTMGGQTIDAINEIEDQDALVTEIATSRENYYGSLTFNRDGSRNQNQKFLKGWLARVDRCLGAGR